MNDLIFSMAVQHAMEKVTERDLTAIIATLDCGGSLTEVKQCASVEEVHTFLSSNRGEFIIITPEGFGVITSTSSFEKGVCLN